MFVVNRIFVHDENLSTEYLTLQWNLFRSSKNYHLPCIMKQNIETICIYKVCIRKDTCNENKAKKHKLLIRACALFYTCI